jgi:hypothetical protein
MILDVVLNVVLNDAGRPPWQCREARAAVTADIRYVTSPEHAAIT